MTFDPSTAQMSIASLLWLVFLLFLFLTGLLLQAFVATIILSVRTYNQSLTTHALTTTALVEAIHSLREPLGPQLPTAATETPQAAQVPLPDDKLKVAAAEGIALSDHQRAVARKLSADGHSHFTRQDRQNIALEHIIEVTKRECCLVDPMEKARFARAIEVALATLATSTASKGA